MSRILQVCNSTFFLSHFLAPLVRGLVAAGYEVDCVCGGAANDADSLEGNVRVQSFRFPRKASPAAFMLAVQRMRAILRAGRYDCVDSHNRNASIVGRAASWLERVPINLYTAHGFYFQDGQSNGAYRASFALEAMLARITDYTLSQSADDVAVMTRQGWIRSSRIEAIGNGIDTQRFVPCPDERPGLERALRLRSGRFRIVSTGRLVRGKGFTDLLRAFVDFRRERPDAELMIIGGNIPNDIEPYKDEFLAQVRESGFEDAITVTGMVGNVENYLASSDLFVLPSYREGMPRALLEAMSMGLPVVATNIRGCREIVRQGYDGWLYEPHDVRRLATLMGEIHADPVGSAAAGRRARERVCESFDERAYVARQVAAIERLLGSAGRANRRGRTSADTAPPSSRPSRSPP